MQKYKQLTQEQRCGIKLMLNQGFNQIDIAEHIGVQKSTQAATALIIHST